jgi:hypothetical protein
MALTASLEALGKITEQLWPMQQTIENDKQRRAREDVDWKDFEAKWPFLAAHVQRLRQPINSRDGLNPSEYPPL